VLGLGGRLLGALAGRFAPPVGCEEELTNFEDETLGLCAWAPGPELK